MPATKMKAGCDDCEGDGLTGGDGNIYKTMRPMNLLAILVKVAAKIRSRLFFPFSKKSLLNLCAGHYYHERIEIPIDHSLLCSVFLVTMAVIAPGADVVQHSKSVHFIFVYIICLWCNSLPVESLHHISLFKFHGYYKNIKLQVFEVLSKLRLVCSGVKYFDIFVYLFTILKIVRKTFFDI